MQGSSSALLGRKRERRGQRTQYGEAEPCEQVRGMVLAGELPPEGSSIFWGLALASGGQAEHSIVKRLELELKQGREADLYGREALVRSSLLTKWGRREGRRREGSAGDHLSVLAHAKQLRLQLRSLFGDQSVDALGKELRVARLRAIADKQPVGLEGHMCVLAWVQAL